MRACPIWTLLVVLLATLTLVTVSASAAQGDGPIEPVEPPVEVDPTPPAQGEIAPPGDGPIEQNGDEELPNGDQSPPPVEPTEPYRVEVRCAFSAQPGTTECVFTGVPPASHFGPVVFLMPAELACAEVTGGDYAYVAPDPVTGLNGYRPVGDTGRLTLTLAGVVTPGGTATYWFESPAGIVPGTGPALTCSPAPSGQQPTPAPTSAPAPITGTLMVRTLTCDDVPADRAGYDWFGACEPIAYRLAPTGGRPESTAEAETVFGEVPPGRYDLAAMGFTWCHAVSDNVTAEGEVVIDPGTRTTVWIFLCRGA